MGRADFRSVWPGVARTMRAESAKVTVLSVPLSSVTTTEAPETDLTVPTTRDAGAAACAEASRANAPKTIPIHKWSTTHRWNTRISTLILLNHAADCRVKNCQTTVKVVRFGWLISFKSGAKQGNRLNPAGIGL